MPKSEVFNRDCMEVMTQLPTGYFQLGIADPPYGLDKKSVQGAGKLKNRTLNRQDMAWDVRPDAQFFAELMRVCQHVIIWGGNYFELPPCRCFVCWDKCQPWPNFSQAEFAWTNIDAPAKMFTFDNRTGDKFHPTQKPVELYAYCLRTFAKVDKGTIFDPMMGSQSSRIAAHKLGFDYMGCEINQDYYKQGCEWFERECHGVIKAETGHTIIEQSLF